MILAYAHTGISSAVDVRLCLVPDKPDALSIALPIDSIAPSVAGIYRVGPIEGVTVDQDQSDGGLIITPVKPSPLYITTNFPDKPGVKVTCLKIVKQEDGQYRSFYLPEFGGDGSWKEWNPRAFK